MGALRKALKLRTDDRWRLMCGQVLPIAVMLCLLVSGLKARMEQYRSAPVTVSANFILCDTAEKHGRVLGAVSADAPTDFHEFMDERVEITSGAPAAARNGWAPSGEMQDRGGLSRFSCQLLMRPPPSFS